MSASDPAAIPMAAVRLLLATNPLPMWIYDLETLRFLEVNQAAISRYGYSRADFLQRRITDIRPEEEREALERDLSSPRPPFQASGPWHHRTADGRVLTVLISSHLLTWDGRPAAFVTVEVRPDPAHPAEGPPAVDDPLRALPGDAALIQRTAAALARMTATGRAPTLLLLDVDTPEDVVAGLGASGFGALLRDLTQRLAPHCPGGLHRVGGTSFGALFEDADEGQPMAAATALLVAAGQPTELAGVGPITLSASIGLRTAGPEDHDAVTLLADAGLAMRLASRQGGGRIVAHDLSLHRVRAERFGVEQALRAALRARQFRLHYQPVVELGSGRVEGLEALLRWQRPGHGLVGPDAVIAAAEASGLIVPIGRWVMERAVTDAATVRDQLPAATMAVNLSAHQLGDEGLREHLVEACRRAGIPASALCLELTETAFVGAGGDDSLSHHARLLSLRATGATLAIDDFGTGYSALSYLRHLPVDVVKIDRSFVTGFTENAADAILVEAIIRLAHALGLRVVAEGVETRAQATALRELGADAAQGYLFARPAPLASVLADLASGALEGLRA